MTDRASEELPRVKRFRAVAQNRCIQCGLFYEIRPVDPEKATAFARTTETPVRYGA